MVIQLWAGGKPVAYGIPFILSREEHERIVDLQQILQTLYTKKAGKGVSVSDLEMRGKTISHLLDKYEIRDASQLPRLHASEAQSIADLPEFYTARFLKARRKERRLSKQIDETYEQFRMRHRFESYFCLSEAKKIGYNEHLEKYRVRVKKTRMSYYKTVDPDSDDSV